MTTKIPANQISTVAVPGTDGKQLAQGELKESWNEDVDGVKKTFGSVDVGRKTVTGEML
ncbi:hypothetical protein [Salipiger mucosus]|uniref:Uncharacterized protein n=1 Tax=Salipiger mucosus DSM 16094 TaxID=1123237 RepID=S9QWH2_9RHOB|nr:hypothetical protein [Salipiger mucosus]EPX83963.1 hypothetical protein Salmuc_01738 [Salipiger mucosus DSM 16094]